MGLFFDGFLWSAGSRDWSVGAFWECECTDW